MPWALRRALKLDDSPDAGTMIVTHAAEPVHADPDL
jgi:hypothetical protein